MTEDKNRNKPEPGGKADTAQDERPRPTEVGGPKGPEPTRYGDWETGGIASDF